MHVITVVNMNAEALHLEHLHHLYLLTILVHHMLLHTMVIRSVPVLYRKHPRQK